jgi:hypothetical protein
MREKKFRLRNYANKIVGYEKWYVGERDEEIGSYKAIPQWLYSTDGKYWNPQEINHRFKDQFTGLQDKNGKEIYEGDIVNLGGEINFEVIWETSEFTLENYKRGRRIIGNILVSRGEVIGNIYENPELLNN